MEELVADLMARLSEIADQHAEIYDPEISEQIALTLDEGYVDNTDADPYRIRREMGLSTPEGELALVEALQDFIDQAPELAIELDLEDAEARRDLLRDEILEEILGEEWWDG